MVKIPLFILLLSCLVSYFCLGYRNCIRKFHKFINSIFTFKGKLVLFIYLFKVKVKLFVFLLIRRIGEINIATDLFVLQP